MTAPDRQQTFRARSWPAAWIVVAVIGTAILVAACGGSSSKSSTIALGLVPAKFRLQVGLGLKYSECMRSHGVPNFGDPKISVSSTELIMQNPQMSSTEVASPAYQSATAACAKYLPLTQAPTVTSAPNTQPQAVRFADCMRAHGVPSFPDPTAGGAFKLGPSINPQAPAFTAAMNDCRDLRPSTLELSR
jgi:hypothetical protein